MSEKKLSGGMNLRFEESRDFSTSLTTGTAPILKPSDLEYWDFLLWSDLAKGDFFQTFQFFPSLPTLKFSQFRPTKDYRIISLVTDVHFSK